MVNSNRGGGGGTEHKLEVLKLVFLIMINDKLGRNIPQIVSQTFTGKKTGFNRKMPKCKWCNFSSKHLPITGI